MASTVTIDLRQVARGLDIPAKQVQATVELLDEGNTVPFITRYRKDRTGGLDEEQVRTIQDRLTKMRLLSERKQTILRSIEAQGKLTEQLAKQILAAATTKRLEDLYLPFKPKKQTLATTARSRGLEGLAREILEADPLCAKLDARAADYASADRQVPTGADALLGAGHILAEQFSEHAEVRQRLREIMQRTGVIASTRIAPEVKAPPAPSPAPEKAEKPAPGTHSIDALPPPHEAQSIATHDEAADLPEPLSQESTVAADSLDGEPRDAVAVSTATAGSASEAFHAADSISAEAEADRTPADQAGISQPLESQSAPAETHSGEAVSSHDTAATMSETPVAFGTESIEQIAATQLDAGAIAPPVDVHGAGAQIVSSATAKFPGPTAAQRRQMERQLTREQQRAKREQMKKRLEEKRIKSFRDYFDYRDEIKRMPLHRVLALNRGERSKILRVKIETDLQAMVNAVEELLVPPTHPHADYLRGCARDALARLILPSLERETRRELTERAEAHAVDVFAKNLRNLLLQPPIRNHRVLALDPGYKSGCKYSALDQFGNLLEHGVIFLVGKADHRAQAKQKIVEVVKKYQITVVAIGNGTACRDVEKFVAGEVLGGELAGQGVSYVIVNEAGASVYSTSREGREEFPDYDATLRGAISIGRRLLDPLSELVKIEPASIGVGLYQHDMKAKHLSASLDGVVESCVNYVGVDANMASPALLRYVSGLNQLTARRLYEFRREHGPFRNREQLRQVPGLGEATFVQAAGFLKISNGDNPLDATWIHPECYEAAGRLLERLGCTSGDLADKAKVAELAERVAALNVDELSAELQIGALTLKDMLAQFVRPGRDPREDLPPPAFKHGILKLEDLTPGMELTGTVLNVVDFGCFVDIGMHDSGLVHVSHLADRFIRDPHEVVSVGDVVKVWVLSVEKERRRVSLTMVQPGTERPHPPRRPPRRENRSGEGAPADGAATEGSAAGATPQREQGQGGRPPRRERGPRPERPPQGERPQGERPQGERPQGGRPPRREGGQGGQGGGRSARYGGPRRGSSQDRPHGPYEAKAKPKPVIPLTDEMKKGKEPLRTFGDLLQFYELKQEPGDRPAPQPADEPPAAIPEPTAPPAAETPAVQIETQPTDGETTPNVEITPEPRAAEREISPSVEVQAEKPLENEIG
jgi:protein Tex